MRLAFCFMSNTQSRLRDLLAYFNYDANLSPYVIDSYTQNILVNPPLQSDIYLYSNWNIKWVSYECAVYTDYFSLRQDSLAMAGNADFIYVGDDDMRFFEGSSEVINECIKYMILNEDCGAIYLAANFGEEYKYHDKEIYVINNGHIGTNRGIILRNRPVLMDNRLHALGANEDFIIGFTAVMQGYYICRKLHVPIEHPANNNRVGVSPNSNMDFMMSRGIMSKVNKFIGKWTDHNIWPENIFKIYRQEAMKKGFGFTYDTDGSILNAHSSATQETA
jgi:hypothetical protein